MKKFDPKLADKLMEDVTKYFPDRLVEWDGIEDSLKRMLKHYFYNMRYVHEEMSDIKYHDYVEARMQSIINLAFLDVYPMIKEENKNDM